MIETEQEWIARSDKLIADTQFWVEATGFERHSLWVEWNEKIQWERLPEGCVITVGILDSRPVNLGLTWTRLNGHLICFWDTHSQVVDHVQIEAWLDKTTLGKRTWEDRCITCDSMNFHHCLDGLRIR